MQKKRQRLACFVVAAVFAALFSLQGVLADVPFFDGTAVPGEIINTSIGEAFSISYGSTKESILVDFQSESIIIDNNSCDTGNRFEGCYNGATFKGYDRSKLDPEVYSFSLKFTLLSPEIAVSKQIENSTIELGDYGVVRVNITNQGSKPATVYFTEAVPGVLKIAEFPGQLCRISTNNTLSMVLELKPGEVKHCNYRVMANAPGTYYFASTARPDNQMDKKVIAGAFLIVNPLPFGIGLQSRKQLVLGEKENIMLDLNSTGRLDSFIFRAVIPDYLKPALLTQEAFSRDTAGGLEITYGNGMTALNNSVVLKVSSEATGVGLFTVNAKASWIYNGLKQEISADFPINVTFAEPYMRLTDYDAKSGKASVDIVNPSKMPISGVSVASAGFSSANGLPLAASQVAGLSHASFDILLNQSAGNYTGTISYFTVYGQKLRAAAILPINATASAVEVVQPPQPSPNQEKPADNIPPAAQQQEQQKEPIAEEPKQVVNIAKPGRGISLEVIFGVAMAAVIIILVILFFRARKKSYL